MNNFKEEYEKFYQQKAASLVAEFNANRKTYHNEAIAQKIFMFFLLFMLLFIVSAIVVHFLPFESKNKENFIPIIGINLVFISPLVFLLIRHLSPEKTDFSDLRTETTLKKQLMPTLLHVFGNFTWQKKCADLVYDFQNLPKTNTCLQFCA